MLEPIVVNSSGSAQLNSLRRFTLSACIVPRQDLAVVNIPVAPAANTPGMSTPIPMQGPADGKTELYSFTGQQQVVNAGIGTVSVAFPTTTMTGVGTKFLSQLAKGDSVTILSDLGAPQSATVTAIASDTSATLNTTVLGGATNQPFVYVNSNTGANNYLFVQIQDQAWRRYLMNRDVPAVHVFGSQTKPEFIKESIYLEKDQSLLLSFTNYSTTAPASFFPMTEGRKWQFEALKYPNVNKFLEDLRVRKKWVQPYWLTLDKGYYNIPFGASQGGFFTCTGDITLVLFNVYGFAYDTDGNDQTDNVTIDLHDGGTHRALQTQPVPMSCATGTAQNPYRLPTPWIVEPLRQIKVNFTNKSSSSESVYVAMTFHGVAIYTGSNFNGSTLTNKHLIDEASRMYEAMSIPQVRPASPQI